MIGRPAAAAQSSACVKCSVVVRRAKTKGEVRLEYSQLGIVRRGNLNLNKRVIREMSV
jgi:hypothetical protein